MSNERNITIYGLECLIPEQPRLQDIANHGKSKRKCKFTRTEIPDSFNDLVFDEDDNPVYSAEQEEFILEEIRRCVEGYWFLNYDKKTDKLEVTWITGDHYYYLNYWTLEDGTQPEYRDADRRFFIFLNEVREDDYILGCVRGKKRREGATSQGTCVGTKTATFNENARCGNISKTGKDVEDLFVNMIVYGFRALPIFLKPRYDGTEDPRRKLVFVKPVSKKQNVTKKGYTSKREGLNSFIDFRNTALNSYDSGRLTFIMVDESGKWEEIDINKYWQIVSQTLLQGAKKVGYAFLPTTVNPPNKGGQRFKEFWDKCDQFVHGRRTPTRVVKYFQDAADGLPGFIDEYGRSMVEEAAAWLEEEYNKLESEDDRSEFKRMYPRKEEDMFTFAQTESPFSLENIEAQLLALKENPIYLRRGRLIWVEDEKVDFVDDKNGHWLIYEFPAQTNKFIKSNGQLVPGNTHNYVGGVDPFRLNTKGSYSSPGVICIFKNLDASNPNNTGMPVAFYKGRPREKDLFFEECLKGFMYFGCCGTFEMDATDDYIKYFQMRAASKLLNWTPDEAINIHKRGKKIERGVRSADPFALEKQLKVTVSYIEHHCHKIAFTSLLEDLKRYQHDNRTERDETIAFMMCLLSTLGTSKSTIKERSQRRIIETFPVNIFKQ